MPPKLPRSELVSLVMPNATEAEIEEATRRWFGFLLTIERIVREREEASPDSRESKADASL